MAGLRDFLSRAGGASSAYDAAQNSVLDTYAKREELKRSQLETDRTRFADEQAAAAAIRTQRQNAILREQMLRDAPGLPTNLGNGQRPGLVFRADAVDSPAPATGGVGVTNAPAAAPATDTTPAPTTTPPADPSRLASHLLPPYVPNGPRRDVETEGKTRFQIDAGRFVAEQRITAAVSSIATTLSGRRNPNPLYSIPGVGPPLAAAAETAGRYFTDTTSAADKKLKQEAARWYAGPIARDYFRQNPSLLQQATSDPIEFYQMFQHDAKMREAGNAGTSTPASASTPATTPTTTNTTAAQDTTQTTGRMSGPSEAPVVQLAATAAASETPVPWSTAHSTIRRDPTLTMQQTSFEIDRLTGIRRAMVEGQNWDAALSLTSQIAQLTALHVMSTGVSALGQLEQGDTTLFNSYMSAILGQDVVARPQAATSARTSWNRKFELQIGGGAPEVLTIKEMQDRAQRTFDPAYRAMQVEAERKRQEALAENAGDLAVADLKGQYELLVAQTNVIGRLTEARQKGRMDAELAVLNNELDSQGLKATVAGDDVYITNGRGEAFIVQRNETPGPRTGGVFGIGAQQGAPVINFSLVPVQRPGVRPTQ